MLIFFRLMKLGILILKVWSHVLSLVRPTRVVNIESKRFHHTITYRRMEISRINRSLKAYKVVKYCPLVVHNGYVFITTPLFFFLQAPHGIVFCYSYGVGKRVLLSLRSFIRDYALRLWSLAEIKISMQVLKIKFLHTC